MYMKTVGSVLVIATSTWLGCLMGRELYERLDRLGTMKRIFLLIRQEILYAGMPLFEVFGNVSKRFDEPYKTWLLSLEQKAKERNEGGFMKIWKDSLYENLGQQGWKKKDLESLEGLGMEMAGMDREELVKVLDLYIERLEWKVEGGKKEMEQKNRIFRSLGLMGGIFAVVLLF